MITDCAIRCRLRDRISVFFVPSCLRGHPASCRVPDWLVITADQPGAGRGVRGYALLWFLRTYFGRRAVAKRTPDEVARGAAPRPTRCSSACPRRSTPDEIRRLVDARASAPHRAVRLPRPPRARLDARAGSRAPRADRPLLQTVVRAGVELRPPHGPAAAAPHRQLFLSIALGPRSRASSAAAAAAVRRRASSAGPTRTRVVGADGADRSASTSASPGSASCASDAPDLTFCGGLTEWDNDAFRQREAAEPDAARPALRPQQRDASPPTGGLITQQPRAALPRRQRAVDLPPLRMPVRRRRGGDDRLPPARHARAAAAREHGARPRRRLGRARRARGAGTVAEPAPTLGEENFAHLERYLHYGSYAKAAAR